MSCSYCFSLYLHGCRAKPVHQSRTGSLAEASGSLLVTHFAYTYTHTQLRVYTHTRALAVHFFCFSFPFTSTCFLSCVFIGPLSFLARVGRLVAEETEGTFISTSISTRYTGCRMPAIQGYNTTRYIFTSCACAVTQIRTVPGRGGREREHWLALWIGRTYGIAYTDMAGFPFALHQRRRRNGDSYQLSLVFAIMRYPLPSFRALLPLLDRRRPGVTLLRTRVSSPLAPVLVSRLPRRLFRLLAKGSLEQHIAREVTI